MRPLGNFQSFLVPLVGAEVGAHEWCKSGALPAASRVHRSLQHLHARRSCALSLSLSPLSLYNVPLLCVFYACLTFFCFSGGDFEGNRILLNPGSTNCVSRHTFLSIYMVSGPGESGGSTPPPRGLLNVAPCHFYQRKGPRNCLRFRATSLSDVVLVRSDMYVRSAN